MTRAPQFDALVTDPVFPVTFRAFSEGIYGHGVIAIDGLAATSGSGDFDVDVATGEVQYDGSRYSNDSVATVTVGGPDADPRWDVVYFDTATESVGLRAGDPGPVPVPPDIGDGEVLLAYIEIGIEASNVTDEDIRNWRARPQPAMNVPLDHADVDGETVHEGLGWLNGDKASTPHGNEDHDPDFSEEGHDHSGESISPAEATVDDAPTEATDVVRKTELDDVEDDVDTLAAGQAALEDQVDDAESDISDLQDSVGIDTMAVTGRSDLPDPTGLDNPVIAYIDEEDRYAGVFQE